MAFSAVARQAGQAWRAPADAWGKAVWNRQPLSRLEGHSALRTVQKSVREEPSRCDGREDGMAMDRGWASLSLAKAGLTSAMDPRTDCRRPGSPSPA